MLAMRLARPGRFSPGARRSFGRHCALDQEEHSADHNGDICQVKHSRPHRSGPKPDEIDHCSIVEDAVEQIPYTSACQKRECDPLCHVQVPRAESKSHEKHQHSS